jgi:hypothetical protein
MEEKRGAKRRTVWAGAPRNLERTVPTPEDIDGNARSFHVIVHVMRPPVSEVSARRVGRARVVA